MTLQLWDSLDYLLDDFISIYVFAAAAKSCLTLWDPIDGSPPGSPCPWDSPGKNTGVGCHFLLQCMKVKGESEVVHSCLTLSDPMDCSLPGSSIHGIFWAPVLKWGAIAFSQELHYHASILLLSQYLNFTLVFKSCMVLTVWSIYIA